MCMCSPTHEVIHCSTGLPLRAHNYRETSALVQKICFSMTTVTEMHATSLNFSLFVSHVGIGNFLH